MTGKYQARCVDVVSFVAALLLASIPLGAPADDTNPRALFAQGFYLLQNEQPSKAAEKFEQGLEIDPNNAQAHYYLGEAYLAMSRRDLAKEHYETSLSIDAHSDVADDAKTARRYAFVATPGMVHLHCETTEVVRTGS